MKFWILFNDTPLINAIYKGKIEIIKLLLTNEYLDINYKIIFFYLID